MVITNNLEIKNKLIFFMIIKGESENSFFESKNIRLYRIFRILSYKGIFNILISRYFFLIILKIFFNKYYINRAEYNENK